ncbi:hypothetical protein EDD85DRAFT_211483 [Armillaria nabsnona]|nr:hypothetical protein EDD85DRAFT_211483 [Armillaria nabsnona]
MILATWTPLRSAQVAQAKVDVAAFVIDEMLEFMNVGGMIQVIMHHAFRLESTSLTSHRLCISYFDSNAATNRSRSLCQYFQSLLFVQSRKRDLSARKDRVTERIGMEGGALGWAMRLSVCMDVEDEINFQTLRSLQCEGDRSDGGLTYRYGSSGRSIKNQGSTTAMTIHTIQYGSRS